MNFANISLFQATPDQIRVSRERTHEQWGRGLSLDEFMKRDAAFEDLPHAKDGRFVVWILSTRDNPSTNLDFFAACETFEREVAASTGSSSSETANEPQIGYGVASVFTPLHHRGKGYARHMMRLLHYVLAEPNSLPPFPSEWGSPPTVPAGFGRGIVSVLYSDIGSRFYQACGKGLTEGTGWIVRKPINTIWTLPVREEEGEPVKIEEITEETQHGVWDEDARLIREEITTSSTPCFSFLPDQGVANYMQARSEFFASTKGTGQIWGATLPDRPKLSFVTWAQDPGREGPQTLLITRLRSTPEDFPTLLHAAFKAARDFNLEQVEIWNLDPSLQMVGESDLGGKTSERDDHLPSVAWYGEDSVDGVEWRYNEKFCWC